MLEHIDATAWIRIPRLSPHTMHPLHLHRSESIRRIHRIPPGIGRGDFRGVEERSEDARLPVERFDREGVRGLLVEEGLKGFSDVIETLRTQLGHVEKMSKS